MPAKTERQRRAAGADLRRVREGKEPRTFKNMGEEKLRHFAMKKTGKRRKIAAIRAGY